MNIKDYMTKQIIVIQEFSSLKAAASKMKEFDIGFLPVVNEKKVIGVVTDRDLVTRGCANAETNLSSVITRNLITIPESSTVETALITMKEKKIKRVLVVKEQKLVGIVSYSDLLRKNVPRELLLDTIESIQEINRNTDYYKTEIDEFYL